MEDIIKGPIRDTVGVIVFMQTSFICNLDLTTVPAKAQHRNINKCWSCVVDSS